MKNHKITITESILVAVSEIDEFKGSWAFLKNLSPDKLISLRKIATIESVGSSTRIEGVKLTDDAVERLLSGLQVRSFKSRDEEEVAGYAELMNVIFESYMDIPLTENHIKQLHGILLQYASKDERHRGDYKKLPNDVHAFNEKGKSLGVVFSTATPFDTPIKMTELVSWSNQAIFDKKLHPLLIVATFIVHFLAIHPFQDGNGRLSRALTTLILLKLGYSYIPYASLESIVEQSKERYYLALRKSQKTIDEDTYNIQPWLDYFLQTLQTQKDNLVKKLDGIKATMNLPELSRKILELAKSLGRITFSDITDNINANPRTLRYYLYNLANDGYLIKSGERKSTWYRLGKLD